MENGYVYLLKFKYENLIKVGFSVKPEHRIAKLSRHYVFDETESKLFKVETPRLAKVLESEILNIFPQYEGGEYIGYDGSTEIKDSIYYDDICTLIKTKHPNYNIAEVSLEGMIRDETSKEKELERFVEFQRELLHIKDREINLLRKNLHIY